MTADEIMLLTILAFVVIGWACKPSKKDNAAAERANRRLFK
jgi:hypothetical protein